MDHWIVGAGLAALIGVLISAVNYRLSCYIIQKKPELLGLMSLPRQIFNIAYLVIVYLAAPYLPWGLMPPLVGAAVGMTGAMFYFTQKLLKVSESQKEKNSGGDDNG